MSPSVEFHTRVVLHHAHCDVGCTISHFFDSAGTFFSQLANLNLGALLIGLVAYAAYLTLRSRALWGAIQTAYPSVRVRWREIWGAYMVGYTVNNVSPLSGGNLPQLFLTRISIPPSSYTTLAAAYSTGVIFDWLMGLAVMCYAFTQGVFPKPPSFAQLNSFDISFFASNMRFTLFFVTVLGVLFMFAFAFLSTRVQAFWRRVRQGFTILRDRRLYYRRMCSWQFASWVARFISYWALLDAFHVGGSVRNVLLVLGVQVVASVFPFTPSGAGVQQALLVTIFSHSRYVAAFSVGQQIAIAIGSSLMGFGALVLIFRFRSFREVIARGKAHRRQDAAADPENQGRVRQAVG